MTFPSLSLQGWQSFLLDGTFALLLVSPRWVHGETESIYYGRVPESWTLARKCLDWTVFQNKVLRRSFHRLGCFTSWVWTAQGPFARKREMAVFLLSVIGGTEPRGGGVLCSILRLAVLPKPSLCRQACCKGRGQVFLSVLWRFGFLRSVFCSARLSSALLAAVRDVQMQACSLPCTDGPASAMLHKTLLTWPLGVICRST